MNSRPSTPEEVAKYKEAFRVREKLPPLEVTTVDGDHAFVEEAKPERILNPTCATLRKCNYHKIPINECAECYPQWLRSLGELSWFMHCRWVASRAAKRERESSLQERTKGVEHV